MKEAGGMKHTSSVRVLVVGGLGRIGSQVVEYLARDGFIVAVLDLQEKIKVSNSNNPTYFMENGSLYLYENGQKSLADDIFEVIIIAIRVREGELGKQTTVDPLSEDAIRGMVTNFEATVARPLEIIGFITKHRLYQNKLSLIYLYSTNSTTVSHQDLAYHVVNGAIPQLCRYLALNIRNIGVNVYPVEIGAINLDTAKFDSVDRNPAMLFPPVDFLDFYEVVKFLCRYNSPALSGSPITLGGGRNLMDSTAYYENHFGD